MTAVSLGKHLLRTVYPIMDSTNIMTEKKQKINTLCADLKKYLFIVVRPNHSPMRA